MQRSLTSMDCVISAGGIFPTEEKVEAITKAPRTKKSKPTKCLPWNHQLPRDVHPQSEPDSSATQPAPSERPRVHAVPLVRERPSTRQKNPSLPHMCWCITIDPSLPVILKSDASQYGIWAVILHRFPNGCERPIAYASGSLNLSNKNYSQIEKEDLPIICGMIKHCLYLFGLKFTL